jgi:hypothetical protein
MGDKGCRTQMPVYRWVPGTDSAHYPFWLDLYAKRRSTFEHNLVREGGHIQIPDFLEKTMFLNLIYFGLKRCAEGISNFVLIRGPQGKANKEYSPFILVGTAYHLS